MSLAELTNVEEETIDNDLRKASLRMGFCPLFENCISNCKDKKSYYCSENRNGLVINGIIVCYNHHRI